MKSMNYDHAVAVGDCYRLDRQLRKDYNVAVSTSQYAQKSIEELEAIREILADQIVEILEGRVV